MCREKDNKRARFLLDGISEQLHLQLLLSEMNESSGKAFLLQLMTLPYGHRFSQSLFDGMQGKSQVHT